MQIEREVNWKRRLGITEYKRSQISNAREMIGKTNRIICRTLQSQENNFNKYNQIGVTK